MNCPERRLWQLVRLNRACCDERKDRRMNFQGFDADDDNAFNALELPQRQNREQVAGPSCPRLLLWTVPWCRLEAPTGAVARVAASLFCVGKHATITPSPRCVGRWFSCTESPTAYGDRQPPSVTSPYSHRLSGRICRSICLSRVARFNSVTPTARCTHTISLALEAPPS